MNIKGINTFFLNTIEMVAGFKKARNKAVATPSRKIAMVTGVALVNLMNTGTNAMSINVIAASIPTLKFPS